MTIIFRNRPRQRENPQGESMQGRKWVLVVLGIALAGAIAMGMVSVRRSAAIESYENSSRSATLGFVNSQLSVQGYNPPGVIGDFSKVETSSGEEFVVPLSKEDFLKLLGQVRKNPEHWQINGKATVSWNLKRRFVRVAWVRPDRLAWLECNFVNNDGAGDRPRIWRIDGLLAEEWPK
jgi:hypothetical protein